MPDDSNPTPPTFTIQACADPDQPAPGLHPRSSRHALVAAVNQRGYAPWRLAKPASRVILPLCSQSKASRGTTLGRAGAARSLSLLLEPSR
jgi:hypothetical protein